MNEYVSVGMLEDEGLYCLTLNHAHLIFWRGESLETAQTMAEQFNDPIAQLEAALKQEQEAHEEDVAQLVKHCACEWEGEEPRRHTVTCGKHRQLESRVSELEALYSNSCSALNAHMEIHAQVVNRVKELEKQSQPREENAHVCHFCDGTGWTYG